MAKVDHAFFKSRTSSFTGHKTEAASGTYWATCWRCGVDFDDSKFLYGAPCADCQLDVPGNWVRGRGENGTLSKAELDTLVTKLNGIGFTDPEIVEELGLSNRQKVWAVRKRLGIPAVYRPEKHMWKDEEAHREHARNMVYARKSVGKGMSFYEANYGQASREAL